MEIEITRIRNLAYRPIIYFKINDEKFALSFNDYWNAVELSKKEEKINKEMLWRDKYAPIARVRKPENTKDFIKLKVGKINPKTDNIVYKHLDNEYFISMLKRTGLLTKATHAKGL